ncbi:MULTISPECIES: hypothetical protein [unclassified Rhodococcus (in: high G+C Gram-positive bacteria)]|uniref:hypothetical protein n=1 Tax=unclassified Rhodococcus (in: high G+C Gram-positive bacteria) TaxID=192944 RepID=UPI0020CED4A0|nr:MULTISPECIES: hypothetical protein [unclassified Rhodococcus (in: high G+C Gram-positive bacteria)]
MATFSAEVEEYDVESLRDCVGGPEWEVQPERVAVLVHDMQPYYLNVLDQSVCTRVAAEVSKVVSRARALGIPIVASGPRTASAIQQRGLLGPMWGLGPSAEEGAITRAGLRSDREAQLQRLLRHRSGGRTAPTWP